MKMKKLLTTMLLTALTLTGCESNTRASFVYNIETGEKIEVKLDTTDGYKLSAEGASFIVSSNDDEVLTTGHFRFLEQSKDIIENAEEYEGLSVIEENLDTYPQYLFFKYEQPDIITWRYEIRFNDDGTGVQIVNDISEESATEIYNLLSFSEVSED